MAPNVTTFPVYVLDGNAAKSSFNNVGKAIDNCDYRHAIELATSTLDQIQQQLLLPILNHRACAFAMLSSFDDAIDDAENMIALAPDLCAGYLRLGDVYYQQGMQSYAIDTYNNGLLNARKTDQGYDLLLQFRELAMKQSNKKVDFIAELPTELVCSILSDLDTESKAACLYVSSQWRQKLIECSEAWTTLTVLDGDYEMPIANSLRYIAHHVEELTIDTNIIQVWRQYFMHMKDSHFLKLKSLSLEGKGVVMETKIFKVHVPDAKALLIVEDTTRHFDLELPISTATAFWKIKNTLTTLSLDLGENTVTSAMTIANVLFTCINLTTLKYTTAHLLSDILGNVTVWPECRLLIDFHLEAAIIDGLSMDPLLRQCPKIRRLVIHGCSDDSVLGIIRKHCLKLELLGYNPSEEQFPTLDDIIGEDHSTALRAIYSSTGVGSIPFADMTQLLMQNMETLEWIDIDICQENEPPDDLRYSGLKLENLKTLGYWSNFNSDDFERTLLQSISDCTALDRISISSSFAVDALVEALLSLPPVGTLWLVHTQPCLHADVSFTRLFQYYATSLHTAKLKDVLLGNCRFITDEVLLALADVKSLTSVALYQLDNVSSDGLQTFLEKLDDNVSSIELGPYFDAVEDRHLGALSKKNNLKEVILRRLHYISDYGIITMIDKTIHLESLTLSNCETITDKALKFARQNVYNVEVFTDLQ